MNITQEIEKDVAGKVICPKCKRPISSITMIVQGGSYWDFDDEKRKYVKAEDAETFTGIYCGECDDDLWIDNMNVLEEEIKVGGDYL